MAQEHATGGFVALSFKETASVSALGLRLDPGSTAEHRDVGGHLRTWTWGDSAGVAKSADELLVLDAGADPGGPPSVCVTTVGDRLEASTDWLGFRQLYIRREAEWVGVSTSSSILAQLAPTAVDLEAVAELSLMGWLVGDRTPYVRVKTVPPGRTVVLARGRATWTTRPATPVPYGIGFRQAVSAASELLAERMALLVTEVPGLVLQLTGGLDSRVLLAAIPRDRRRDITAMTLSVPGSQDVAIAAQLSAQFGIRHSVVGLGALDHVSPEEAYDVITRSSDLLDASADPVQTGALDIVESQLPPQTRVAGLGGEVTRGFYYAASVYRDRVTARRAQRLCDWRLFPNGSVPDEMLASEFASRRHGAASRAVFDALRATESSWDRATDEFYLWQRTRRWAGTLASAQPSSRPTVNPMLDERFLAVARALNPRDKKGMAFLAALLVQLEPDLARVPLDARPAPSVYATPGPRRAVRLAALTAQKAGRKASQRLRAVRRAPTGGARLTAEALKHWRKDPDRLRAGVDLGVVAADWYEDAAAGDTDVSPAALALLVNLATAHQRGGADGASWAAATEVAPVVG